MSLCGSFLVQGGFILICAILLARITIPQSTGNSKSNLFFIVIPLLASQFGAQVATSRTLGYHEIPTTVLTSLYSDFSSDPDLFVLKNPRRDRRALAAIMMFLGGVSGAFLSWLPNGFRTVLWLGGTIKIVIAFLWLTFDEQCKNLKIGDVELADGSGILT